VRPAAQTRPRGRELGIPFPGQTGGEGYSINWHVPIDDTHHWKYTFVYSAGAPLKAELLNGERSELSPDYRLMRNESNRFLQDRDAMKSKTYAGMGTGFQAHDAFATASQGAIQDRTDEHLVSSDKAIVAARKLMEKAINDIREGREAPHVVRTAGQPSQVLNFGTITNPNNSNVAIRAVRFESTIVE